MKKVIGMVLILAILLTVCGCTGTQQQTEPTATATATTARFESYVTQTTFHFSKSWEYQDDEDVGQGMTALFAFDGGQAAVQFLWMDETQAQHNVFLQQLDMDDVTAEAYTAGAYEGTLVSGVEDEKHTVAFEGSRSWYDVAPKLYMRAVVEATGENAYTMQRQNFLDLLASITVTQDADPPAVDQRTLERYDFVEDFGLALTAPNSWWLTPDYDFENSLLILEFQAAAGDSIYRVETGAVTQTQYEDIVRSLRDLEGHEDVYGYAFSQHNGVVEVTCLQEGKINRVRLSKKEENGRVRYLWVSSALRPVLDEAYYQTVIVPSMDSIDWT